MADATAIEWCDATWNPIVGCEVASPGCKNCYAMSAAARIERMAAGAGRSTHYAGLTTPSKGGPVFTGRIAEAPEHILTAPLRWTRPRRIFVNSMGDLFAPGVTDAMRDRVWAVMALCPQHTFMVLTKRASAMRAYFARLTSAQVGEEHETSICPQILDDVAADLTRTHGDALDETPWPLPNVWLGVTAEDQPRADERIPELLATPAAIRFVSYEPAIGPVEFRCLQAGETRLDMLTGRVQTRRRYPDGASGDYVPAGELGFGVDWVICGGESGRGEGVRPMRLEWARKVRDDCAAAGVPFFFKQWGEHMPAVVSPGSALMHDAAEVLDWAKGEKGAPGTWFARDEVNMRSGAILARLEHLRVGKARAGRLLDGRTHDAFPEARS